MSRPPDVLAPDGHDPPSDPSGGRLLMQDTREERWRRIDGFPDYEVSDIGRIRSWKRYRGMPVPRLKSLNVDSTGYLGTSLNGGPGVKVRRHVHVLVLQTFGDPRPDGCEARHLNGDPHDNALTNLA